MSRCYLEECSCTHLEDSSWRRFCWQAFNLESPPRLATRSRDEPAVRAGSVRKGVWPEFVGGRNRHFDRGRPLSGVTVRVQGSDVRPRRTRAEIHHHRSGQCCSGVFARWPTPVPTTIAGRSTVDVTMAQISYLEEVVVTAYTEQRRADITGAVSSVNVEAVERQTGASVLHRMDATVPV